MIEFKAGHSYKARSVCDHNTIIEVQISSRTAKTIKTNEGKSLRIGVYEGVEFVKPWGSYSMAPIVKASQLVS